MNLLHKEWCDVRGTQAVPRRPPTLTLAAVLVSLVFLSFAMRAGARSAQALPASPPAPVREITLKNGLVVKAIDVPGVDRVCVLNFFRVGGKYDPVGSTGMAHFAEHLLATGETGKFKSRTAEQFFKDYPGGAFTQTFDDCTIIAVVVKKDQLQEEVERAGERMRSLRFDKDDVERERERLLGEIQETTDRRPEYGIYYLSRRSAYSNGYYARQRIGVAAEVEKIRRNDLENYYKRFYHGATAQVVLVGNLSGVSLESLADKYLKPVPAGEKPGLLEGQGQRTPQSDLITQSVLGLKNPIVTLGYFPPALVDRDHAAFMLLVGALQMRAQQELSSTSNLLPAVDFNPYTDPSLLRLNIIGRPIGEAVGAINRLAADLGTQQLAPSELAQARANISIFIEPPPTAQIASLAARAPSFLYTVAFTLVTRDALGIGPVLPDYKAALDRVTPLELQRIARTYLSPQNRVIVAFLPK